MIARMIRLRLAGPRRLLDRTLIVLQDLGVLHLAPLKPFEQDLSDRPLSRSRRHIQRCLSDVESAIDRLPVHDTTDRGFEPPASAAATARHARRIRRRTDALVTAAAALEDERSLLLRYREFFRVFQTFADRELPWPDGQAFYVVLRAGSANAVRELSRTLDEALDGEVAVMHRELSSGEWAVLILTSARVAPKVSALLSAARVEELPAPIGIGEPNLLRAIPVISKRLARIPEELRANEAEREALARNEGPWLSGLRAFLHDQVLRLEARSLVLAADYLFVIEGWLPASRVADLESRIRTAVGQDVLVSVLDIEGWAADSAPVILHNPPLFRPFEVLTRMLPLPKYGTVDPTPFVAVFFPAFFGLIVGDVGHALLLAAIAGVLRLKSAPDSTARSLSIVAMACASSTAVFGVIFGEFFGSLGHFIGLHPLFNREQAMVPFLLLAVTLGVVHVLLGILLASISSWRRGHRRESAGRSVMLAMLVLTALALLAAVEVLPPGLLTPLVIGLLAAFTALIALEGIVAVVELVSTFGHVLSYARIMALGTASLMLAVVANQMVGAMGSVLVGVILGLLFHLVNFAIGVFSSTIHSLRLHYVEFFGAFFSPGGTCYQPLAHWHASP